MNGRLRPKGEMHLSDHVPRMGTNIKHSNGPRKRVNIFISLNTICEFSFKILGYDTGNNILTNSKEERHLRFTVTQF